MMYVLVMMAVNSESGQWPTRDQVANDLDPVLAGHFGDGWVIEGVKSVHDLDVDTLGDIVKDADLTGEQVIELLGRITADSVTAGIEKMIAKAKEGADAAS